MGERRQAAQKAKRHATASKAAQRVAARREDRLRSRTAAGLADLPNGPAGLKKKL